jgi:Fuc2NAc and GlcNAc transferase
MTSLQVSLVLLIVAAGTWWVLGFLISWLESKDIVDTPNNRTIHRGRVPRGGGLVIVVVFQIVLLGLAVTSARYSLFLSLFGLCLCWACLSWWDDFGDLPPLNRFLSQAFFALLTLLAFGYITAIQIDLNTYLFVGGFGAVLTFIGILWVVNLYNFMDGMDGLAASQTIVAALSMAFWFYQADDSELMLCCLVLAASCYGFLVRNWHPAQLFMGDVGSITLGAILVTLFVYGNTRYQIPIISFVLLIGVFVFDASFTILRRLFAGEKIWRPHSQHLYQRLAKTGVNHAHIVIANTILMLLCAMLASLSVLDRDRIVLYVCLEALLLLIYALAVLFKTKNQKSQD